MAVVFLSLNGIGLGHLIRSTIACRALASTGRQPVIFTEGKYRLPALAPFPVSAIPSLWGAPAEVRRRVSGDIQSMAGISLPAVLVEDTHPAPIEVPESLRHVLMVRPTSFEYLLELRKAHQHRFAAFLLCDSPDSPTWPYDEVQTRELASWEKWHQIGPLYRTPSEEEIRDVKTRNGITDEQQICVFTMGGGGVHSLDPKRQDIVRFLRLAREVAEALKSASPHVRLLFVRGPYFPARAPVPAPFEALRDEQHMPALLKIARGAVIRAGFNTTWECLSAGTPFLPLVGTTFAEPVADRVSGLHGLGLIPPDIHSFWFDGAWRSEYRRLTAKIVARHCGRPDPNRLNRLISGHHPSSAKWTTFSKVPPGKGAERIPLVIRIDDVVSPEPALAWLLDLLASRGMRASLEVVPYLADVDEAFFRPFDPEGTLFEVAQHGYAHVARSSERGRRFEYSPDSVEPTAEERDEITRGKRTIEARFPSRFRGGFSPPFDALPPWLPGQWQALGGAFVSCIDTRSVSGVTRMVKRAGIDIWDWDANRALERQTVLDRITPHLALDGYAGIVLHPRCLRDRADRQRLVSLLDLLAEEGAASVSLHEVAAGTAVLAHPAVRIGRLRKLAGAMR